MNQDKQLPSLDALKERLSKAHAHEAKASPLSTPAASDSPDVLRIGVELTAGVAAGTGLGALLDHWLHTSPWLLIICFFLGAVAGFVNLVRAGQRLDNEQR